MAMQILGVTRDVAVFVQRDVVRSILHWMVDVDGVVGMVPVEQGVVEPDTQIFRAEGVDLRAEEVSTRRGGSGFIIREFGVPKTEAVVVLGRHDEVFHAGVRGGFCPGGGVIKVRVEVLEVASIVCLRVGAGPTFDPFATRREGVEAPVDEETESVVDEPACVSVGGGGLWYHCLCSLQSMMPL